MQSLCVAVLDMLAIFELHVKIRMELANQSVKEAGYDFLIINLLGMVQFCCKISGQKCNHMSWHKVLFSNFHRESLPFKQFILL